MNKIILKVKALICILQNPAFIIQIENGKTTRLSGNVRPNFMHECSEIVMRNELKFGLIYAPKSEYGKPMLKASSEVPQDVLQQLRNVWNFS